MPPLIGPNATAIPETADQTPIALARSTGSRKTSITIANVAGKIAAAPMPIAPRAMINAPVESANEAQTEQATKATMPN